MKYGILLCAFALCGCIGSFAKVVDAAGDVPEWFDTRRGEIRGTGYPNVSDVPQIDLFERPGQDLDTSKAVATAEADAFKRAERAQPSKRTPDEIKSLQEDLKRALPNDIALPARPFLTDEEIAEMLRALDQL